MQTAETSSDQYYNVYLLNQNHRTKVLVARFESPQEAAKAAEELGAALNWSIVNYRPKISAKTRARRIR